MSFWILLAFKYWMHMFLKYIGGDVVLITCYLITRMPSSIIHDNFSVRCMLHNTTLFCITYHLSYIWLYVFCAYFKTAWIHGPLVLSCVYFGVFSHLKRLSLF